MGEWTEETAVCYIVGPDRDERLPYVLYAYRTSPQESTKESPVYLLYGWDPRLPT